jgi:tetratricopeptide (TPR) repeat protein
MEESIMKSTPEPKLLALLDKLVNPLDKCQIRLEVIGGFAFPEEWKAYDEVNTFFTYQVKFLGLDVTEGKIYPRQLTEKEIKDAEEAAAAKQKKAPPVKDKKGKEIEEPKPSAEEIERLKKIEEEKLEAERKAKEEWDALDEKTKFYRTYEDKYKQPSIKWEKNGSQTIEKENEQLVVFEERVYDDNGEWIYFVKTTTLTDEEQTKMKKAKPKNLNLLDLNPVMTRAWVDFRELQNPGTTEVIQRCKLEQFFSPEQNQADFPKPNLKELYLLIKLTLTPAITPLIKEVQPKIYDMIPKVQPIPKLPASQEVINEYKGQLVIAMESLAMEYANMFGKEANTAQEPKGKLLLSAQQKKEVRDQRKEKFLYDFNMSGKYNVLKEKMKKCVMKLVRDKFQKTGSLTGVTLDARDQFYSELYVFLIEQMRQTLTDLIKNKKDEMHEDLVVSQEQYQKERDKVIQTVTKESDSDRVLRLAIESEIINDLDECEKHYKNLLAQNRNIPKNWYMFSEFLSRRKQFPKAEEALSEALSMDPDNKDYQILMASILARRGRGKEALVYLSNLIEKEPTTIAGTVYSLSSFIYSALMGEAKLGKKYFAVAQRMMLRKTGALAPKGTQKENNIEIPYLTRNPNPNAQADSAKKIPQLSAEQNDDIWLELIDYLMKHNIFDLAEKVSGQLFDKNSIKNLIFQAQIEYQKGNYDEYVNTFNKIIEIQPKNTDIMLLKANSCFLSDKFYEAEETFLRAFKLKGTNVKTFANFLRLGYIYLFRKAWADAKGVLTKACEMKPNSSFAWLGLGLCCLRLGEYKEGEQALNQANIFDYMNPNIWGYLALLCILDNSRLVQANQALREMLKVEIFNNELLEELADKLSDINKWEMAEVCYKRLLDNWLNGKVGRGLHTNVGNIFSKLAKIYHSQERLPEARVNYGEALKYIEGDLEKEKIELILNDIQGQLESMRH